MACGAPASSDGTGGPAVPQARDLLEPFLKAPQTSHEEPCLQHRPCLLRLSIFKTKVPGPQEK